MTSTYSDMERSRSRPVSRAAASHAHGDEAIGHDANQRLDKLSPELWVLPGAAAMQPSQDAGFPQSMDKPIHTESSDAVLREHGDYPVHSLLPIPAAAWDVRVDLRVIA